MLGWLFGPTLFSVAAAFVAVRIFDAFFDGVTGTVVNTARSGVFVSAWTAVTTASGMRGFSKRVRKLRRLTKG